MTPVGLMRAVQTWSAAHAALVAMPRRYRQGYGHLIEYAPELICWKACRSLPSPLPLHSLHDPKSIFPWGQGHPAWPRRGADRSSGWRTAQDARSGARLKGTLVRGGQSFEKAAVIY
jgi:hypothetical protein